MGYPAVAPALDRTMYLLIETYPLLVRIGCTYSACSFPSLVLRVLLLSRLRHVHRDCCKPSCVWNRGQGIERTPLNAACDAKGNKLGFHARETPNACEHGGAGVIMCPDQVPFFDAAEDAWMGFVAAQDRGSTDDCCDCYELRVDGFSKRLIVQITNHGHVHGLFDLLVPGGGFGDYEGCAQIFPRASSVAQARYGGMHRAQDCEIVFGGFPADVAACRWMFESGIYPTRPPQCNAQFPCSGSILSWEQVRRLPAQASFGYLSCYLLILVPLLHIGVMPGGVE